MSEFLKKAKSALKGKREQLSAGTGPQEQNAPGQSDSPSIIQPASALDILRYRYHHGTNLGSVFVLEKWLSPAMFVDGAGDGSELDAVNTSLRQSGLAATRQKWENHWNTAVSDSDWFWLVNSAHCTSIRLPIGYFTLGPTYCSGTPFDGQPAQVYVNAWAAVKTFVLRARSNGIGVLIDLHALPGGANRDAHSGTSSGNADLWNNPANLALSQKCLLFVVQEIRSASELNNGVVGLELCNEAVNNAPGLYDWYDSVIAAISQIDSSLPIYISDAWDLSSAISYANRKGALQVGTANPVIVDTHKYYCFSDADRQQSPQQIIARIPKELGELDGHDGSVVDRGAAQVIVGEYSCVLDEQSWSKVDASERPGLTNQFGQAQIRRWQERSGGSYFWTFNMNWNDGGEWEFSQQTKSSSISPPTHLTLSRDQAQAKIADAQNSRNGAKGDAQAAHNSYWDQHAPGVVMEHWRFGAGWDVGFSDAVSFFQARVSSVLTGTGADKIGLLDIWIRRRVIEGGQGGQYLWEFEQGLRQGISDFYRLIGI
ncbi:MAG: Glucan 1,3-beta-glucosidase 3 [Geoglossum umbratile]|nr:MAG: Glucan 1,3-beta-glucosidase 3 [Geoglossum umbratile]